MEAQSQRVQERLKDTRENREREEQERDLARLQERLEALMQRHLDRFAEIIERAPEQAKPHLEEAREMSLKGYRAALEALGRAPDHIEASLAQVLQFGAGG
jgi:exonuclease VII large subunit